MAAARVSKRSFHQTLVGYARGLALALLTEAQLCVLLTAHNISTYLLNQRLVRTETLVDGSWQVREASSRNRNFKIISAQQPGLFVKQTGFEDEAAVTSLRLEASLYRLMQDAPEGCVLADLLPVFRHYDPERKVLVTELLEPSETLYTYQRRLGRFPLLTARWLGVALGKYHRHGLTALAEYAQHPIFPRQPPWILRAAELPPAQLTSNSAGHKRLFEIVRQFPQFESALAGLQANWRYESLIHGDMKWDNCLVTVAADAETVLDLKLIDWELADIGDAAWDTGAILQSYLNCWVFSIPSHSDVHIAQLAAQAVCPLETLLPALHEFWNAYVETRELENAPEELERAVKYGAARMIQTVYEHLQNATQVTATLLYLLQVSLNILRDPQAAIRELLEM